MTWTIRMYQTSNGREPVTDFIHVLNLRNPIEAAKVRRSIGRLAEHGPVGVDSKPMGDRLFEVRINGKNIHRIFYVQVKGNTVWLLHAITKKDQKTPKADLDLARNRAAEVLSKE